MAIPRMYLESDTDDPDLITDPDFEIVIKNPTDKDVEPPEDAVRYEKVVYEEAKEAFDTMEFKVKKYLVIEPTDRRSLVFLKPGDEIMILPVEGFVVTPIADVGDKLRKGDPLAAVTTRKGEVRYVEAPDDGIVVFVVEQEAIKTKRPNYEYYFLPTGR
ncbi:MAG: DUF2118 domain-containing protein [Methanopyri archaeon]|jgi:hypothetical protein|nr:DUF2118 domain-containing protein [Methanopyri archaeon]